MASPNDFLMQLRAVFGGQSKGRRTFTLLIVLAVAATMIYMAGRDSGGPYTPLFSNMATEDAGAIVTHLKESGVQYKIGEDGSTISVPRGMAPEIRMQLAQLSLPTGGGIGLEWFDKPPIGMTDRVQEINFVRALQIELGRSIATLSAVDRAKVLLVTKDRSSFLRDEDSKPSASVVLELARGARLSGRNVEGILNLVSRAVEGLEPDRIALIDAHTGEPLNKGSQDSEQEQTESNLAFKSKYEQDLEKNIESMLERWVGRGHVVARVHADFDFSQKRTEMTVFNNDDEVMDRQMIRAENIRGLDAGSLQDLTGARSALPTTTAPDEIAGEAGNASYQVEKSFKVSQTNTTMVEPTPTLNLLTVAVMVDYKEEAVEGEEEQAQALPRTSEELTSFENLVRKTVGYTEERADSIDISVECVPFADVEEPMDDTALQTFQNQQLIRFIVTWCIYGLLGLLATLFIIRPILQALLAAGSMPRMQPALADGASRLPSLPGVAPAESGMPPIGAEGTQMKLLEARRMLEKAETAAVNKEIEDLMKEDPAKAAQLIRSWLEGGK